MIINDYFWPLARLGEGMAALAQRAGLQPQSGEVLVAPAALAAAEADDLPRWVEWAGARLGIEAEPVETTVAEFAAFAAGAGPALIHFAADEGPSFVLLLSSSGGTLHLLGPDLKMHRCPAELLRVAMCWRYEAPLRVEMDRLLALADLPQRQHARVRTALLHERLAGQPLAACWLLRLAPTAGFWCQLAHARLPQRLGWMLALFALVYALEIMGWGLIGNAALNGRFDLGWMAAWVLLLLSLVPLGLLGGWLNATFALDAGRILKRRLLAGALNIDLDSVRHQGAGQMLSRVMESQALEGLAVNGGLSVLVSMVELALAAWVLAIGVGGAMHVLLLLGWLAVTLALAWKYTARVKRWTLMRLDMTHDLIERMVGHRTRLAQEWPARRDAQEDQVMQDYLQTSRRMDGAGVAVFAGVPGGWGVIGLLGLAPGFVAGTASPAGLAIAFGGLLLASRAFTGIAGGVSSLAAALIAWHQVAPMFRAGATVDTNPRVPFLRGATADAAADAGAASAKLVDASQLVFRYAAQGAPVLNGVDLTIRRGERLLLEGPSGGGKSTLASLLVGLRRADSGLLLLNGLDRHTLGAHWHQLATEAPQFHENHILSGTLGFNLLMGRNWPASEAELAHARSLCVELGLGELLSRMPAGMMQMIGETGWQLSHGEKSRIFLARALLQDAQLTIMDESFAALDPETLAQCLNCAFERARTLLVIAHP